MACAAGLMNYGTSDRSEGQPSRTFVAPSQRASLAHFALGTNHGSIGDPDPHDLTARGGTARLGRPQAAKLGWFPTGAPSRAMHPTTTAPAAERQLRWHSDPSKKQLNTTHTYTYTHTQPVSTSIYLYQPVSTVRA